MFWFNLLHSYPDVWQKLPKGSSGKFGHLRLDVFAAPQPESVRDPRLSHQGAPALGQSRRHHSRAIRNRKSLPDPVTLGTGLSRTPSPVTGRPRGRRLKMTDNSAESRRRRAAAGSGRSELGKRSSSAIARSAKGRSSPELPCERRPGPAERPTHLKHPIAQRGAIGNIPLEIQVR